MPNEVPRGPLANRSYINTRNFLFFASFRTIADLRTVAQNTYGINLYGTWRTHSSQSFPNSFLKTWSSSSALSTSTYDPRAAARPSTTAAFVTESAPNRSYSTLPGAVMVNKNPEDEQGGGVGWMPAICVYHSETKCGGSSGEHEACGHWCVGSLGAHGLIDGYDLREEVECVDGV